MLFELESSEGSSEAIAASSSFGESSIFLVASVLWETFELSFTVFSISCWGFVLDLSDSDSELGIIILKRN